MNRRDFLKAVGVATGGAMVAGCEPKKGTHKAIAPLFPPPEGILPGEPYHLPTTCTECPAGCGITATLIDGVPIKLEGTPGHPVNDGALCARGQASLSRLYNPRRIGKPMRRDGSGWKEIEWDEAYDEVSRAVRDGNASGRKSYYLSGRTTGTLATLVDEFARQTGVVRLPEYEVFDYAGIRRANELVFGRAEVPSYRIEDCDLLITVGADILQTFGSPVSQQKQLARAKKNGLKWVHVEPHVSLEGLQCHQRIVVKPGTEPYLLAYLLRLYGKTIPGAPAGDAETVSTASGISREHLDLIAGLVKEAKKPLVIAGGISASGDAGFATAVLAAQLQAAGGMLGRLDFGAAMDNGRTGTAADLARSAKMMNSADTAVVFLTRTDPVATAPAALKVADALAEADLRVALSDVVTPTTEKCDIILPLSHALESAGDVVARKGLRGLVQPVIERKLHDTETEGDILLSLVQRIAGKELAASFDGYARRRWIQAYGQNYEQGLADKGYRQSEASPVAVSARGVPAGLLSSASAALPASGEHSLVLTPSIRFHDGRSRALKLMHELPDPLTTITYGEWVSIPQETADEMSLQDGDEVEITSGEWTRLLPVKLQPRLPSGVLMVEQALAGEPAVASGTVTGTVGCWLPDVKLRKTGKAVKLPIMSGSHSQHGRGIVPDPVHLDSKHEHKDEEHGHGEAHHDLISLYPDRDYKDYRWAMAIDLDACTGCGACVAACHIENNVPLSGREEHLKGREMSWLRIEPYYDGKEGAAFLPMLCQQCGAAPCEAVCPVFAAYHNPEGLNAQIYNRCVGTRYCANNCPYKVRRFNWFDYRPRKDEKLRNPHGDLTDTHEMPLDWVANPLVSQRGRGVMEKCTFCVQRIRAGRDHAKDENRKVRDGEVIPACAQTCPSEAIVFGNALDEDSAVARLAGADSAHRVLEELGTQPAVHYVNGTKDEKGEA